VDFRRVCYYRFYCDKQYDGFLDKRDDGFHRLDYGKHDKRNYCIYYNYAAPRLQRDLQLELQRRTLERNCRYTR
jgi:hypothetical protein